MCPLIGKSAISLSKIRTVKIKSEGVRDNFPKNHLIIRVLAILGQQIKLKNDLQRFWQCQI